MKNYKFNLNKDDKYIVACSFGPDSMALLNMLIEQGYDVVVAHVNYHKRDVSNFEEASLKNYCKEKGIVCEVLDTTNLKVENNFQNWARKIRYNFFKKVLEKYNAKAVLVAHQQDDLIETYLMQQKRKNIVKYSGIVEKTNIFGVDIIRPLLSFSKAELLEYDQKNNVPFSIDESNLTDAYERNKIRHEIVEKLDPKNRARILDEIYSQNEAKISSRISFDLDEFLNLDDASLTFTISDFIERESSHKDISKSFIDEIRKAFKSKKAYVEISLGKNLIICKDYNLVYLLNKKDVVNYCYKLNCDDIVDDDLFEIDFSKASGDRNIHKYDFPITVKPVSKNDLYFVKDYEVPVRRLFIDWKLPHYLRSSWPGIYNRDSKLIYIPRYREEFVDKHQSKFVIKFIK